MVERDVREIYKDFREGLYEFAYHREDLIKIVFVNILMQGSLLIEDLPGTGKTTFSKAISKLIGYDFGRIQGTSDITPQDVLGGEFFDFRDKEIKMRMGVIFHEMLLIDEINRMNPKTQSAFLQAMEEKKVSLLGVDYPLNQGFFIIATQNPIEHTGTFPLPEAQKDRFLARISLGTPDDTLQLKIITENRYKDLDSRLESLKAVIDKGDIDKHQSLIDAVVISDTIGKKFLKFFHKINESEYILHPISQRAISLFTNACRTLAYIEGRDYVIPEDGLFLLESVLSYRLEIQSGKTDILKQLYNSSLRSL